MTRSMEENLEQIETGSSTSTTVVNDAKEELIKAITFFEQNEKEIGIQLGKALVTGDREKNPYSKITILGRCPVCRKGKLGNKKSNQDQKKVCRLFSFFNHQMQCNRTTAAKWNNKKYKQVM